MEAMRRALQSLIESPVPEAFTMGCFVRGDLADDPPARRESWCGAPGDILGHYGMRRDLQDLLDVDYSTGLPTLRFRTGEPVAFDHPAVCAHFGITRDQAAELFSATGCGGARSVKEAIAYLRSFIERRVV